MSDFGRNNSLFVFDHLLSECSTVVYTALSLINILIIYYGFVCEPHCSGKKKKGPLLRFFLMCFHTCSLMRVYIKSPHMPGWNH